MTDYEKFQELLSTLPEERYAEDDVEFENCLTCESGNICVGNMQILVYDILSELYNNFGIDVFPIEILEWLIENNLSTNNDSIHGLCQKFSDYFSCN